MVIQYLIQVFGGFTQFYQNIGLIIYNYFITYSRPILDTIHNVFYNGFYVLLTVTIFLTSLFLAISLYVLFKKKEKEQTINEKNLPNVTIQIPTYNELAALNCAKRCLEFDYPKEKLQIIIGDDSSDKSISKKIDNFASKYSEMLLVTRRGSNIGFKPGNLNHMLKFTKGEYIVIFDSDFLPEKDFLKRIVAPFSKDKNVAAVQARWEIKNFSQNTYSVVGGIIPMISHQIALPFLKYFKSNGFIAGSAECIRKKDLLELGGWQEGSLTEDIDYSLRLTAANKKIVYLETLKCECEAPFTLKDVSRQQMRWAYGVIKAFKKHFTSILFNKKVTIKTSVNMYLLVLGYVVTLLFFSLSVFGFFSIISAKPEPIQWGKLFFEMARNFLWTSGFLLSSVITIALSRNLKEAPRTIFASLTVGIVVIFKVTIGIFKALFNRPMNWFMLEKNGNKVKA